MPLNLTYWTFKEAWPILNACDLWSLRQHYFKNQHDCIKGYYYMGFGKPLPVNTVRHCICKCKLRRWKMLKGTSWFCSNICYHSDDIFPREVLAYFSKTLPSHMLHVLQQRGFIVVAGIRLACSPSRLPFKMCGTDSQGRQPFPIMKRSYNFNYSKGTQGQGILC